MKSRNADEVTESRFSAHGLRELGSNGAFLANYTSRRPQSPRGTSRNDREVLGHRAVARRGMFLARGHLVPAASRERADNQKPLPRAAPVSAGVSRDLCTSENAGEGLALPRALASRCDDIGRTANEVATTRNELEAAQRAADAHMAALERLRHSDRILTLGRLASSVAHELGTPLNVIELRAERIASGATSLADARHDATLILEQAQRMTRIIDDVLSFARRLPRKKETVDVVDVVRNAILLSTQTAKNRNVSVRLDAPNTGIDIQCDPDRLLQIVLNLVMNGEQATSDGVLTVRVHDACSSPESDPHGPMKQYVCIEVTDDGPGIPREALPKIFEPFFSTKGVDEGTGLGLSIAQGIAKEYEGWISVASEPGHGTTFSVYLPEGNGAAHGG